MKLKKLFILFGLITCLTASTAFAATEFGVDDDLTVNGTNGIFKDADVEIAGFTTLGSTIGATLHLGIKVGSIWAAGGIEASSYSYFGSSITVISSVTAGALNVSGWAIFSSTVQINTKGLKILGSQSAGDVLMSDGAGFAYWAAAAAGGGDNFGSHIATKNVQMNGFWLSNDGGDEGIFIETDGNVGIGTASPLSKLHVLSESDTDSAVLIASHATGGYGLFVSTTGNVGIGTSAPNTLLEVSGAGNVYMRVTSEDDQKPGIEFFRPGDSYTDWRVENSGGLLYFRTSSTDFETTNTAIALISLSGSALVDPNTVDVSRLKLRIIRSDNSNNEAVGMGFVHSSDSSNVGAAIIHRTVGAESQGTLEFATKDVTTTDADIPIRMTIDHTGNVGIGTTDPFEKLHVAGNILSDYGVKSSTHVFDPGSQPASAEEGSVYYHDSTDKLRLQTASGWVDIATGTVGGGGSGIQSDDDILWIGTHTWVSSATFRNPLFSVGGSTLVVKDGKVGIGTIAPGYRLDVVGDINLSGVFRKGGTAGVAFTCPGGQRIDGAVVEGGIITGGTCVDPGGGSESCAGDSVQMGDICVDKYEASVWSSAGGGTQYGATEDDYTTGGSCDDNGQNCTAVYARSVTGYTPSRYITWFQASAACRNVGKRLLTNAEWTEAARGTPDPGATGSAPNCNVSGGSPHTTGSGTSCESTAGAQDMIGNLWEWVADWGTAGSGVSGAQGAMVGWPADYDGDQMWNIGGNVYNGTAWTQGQIPAVIRGGGWADGASAGVFAFNANRAPSYWDNNLGFRCGRTLKSGIWESGISDVVADLTPQLGGDLDVNSQKIISVSNGDIIIEPHGTGNVGIGTTDPFEKLHVVGDILVSSGSITSNYGIKSSTHVFAPQAGAPASVEGMVYYDDTSNKLKLYMGSAWVDITTGTGGGGNYVSKDGDTMTGQLTVGSSITIIGKATDAFSFAVTTATDQSVYHFFISTMGNVGIGTTAPGSKLDIEGTVTLGEGGIALVIDDSGNVGIGKTDPSYKLDVDDKVNAIELCIGGDCKASWSSVGGGDSFGSHIATENVKLNGYWLSGDGGNEGIFVKADGNVGIATAAPAGLFTVGGGTVPDPALQYAMLVSTGPAASEYIISVSTAGITNIKNLVIDNRTFDPGDPVTGQVWICVDDDGTPGDCEDN